jgi:hypothetical protein
VPVVTIVLGALLTALGIVSYTAVVPYFGRQPYSSVTALIPAFFGAPLVVCGLLALNERFLKHAIHAAAMIGLLGLIGALAVAGKHIPTALSAGTDALERPEAFRSQIAMAVVCVVFVALCVNSFIAARRRRAASGQDR